MIQNAAMDIIMNILGPLKEPIPFDLEEPKYLSPETVAYAESRFSRQFISQTLEVDQGIYQRVREGESARREGIEATVVRRSADFNGRFYVRVELKEVIGAAITR